MITKKHFMGRIERIERRERTSGLGWGFYLSRAGRVGKRLIDRTKRV